MSRRPVVAALIGSFAALLLAAPTFAGAPEEQPIYRLAWNVLPQNPLTEARAIEPGEELARLKLTPPALYRVPSDILDEKGAVLLSEGQQLIGLKSEATIACTIHSVAKRGEDTVLFLGSLKRICLLDSDRDGRFDARFIRATNYPAFFLLRGRLGSRLKPIAPIALPALDPSEVSNPPRVSIKVVGGKPGAGSFELGANVGGDGSPFELGLRLRVKVADLPTTVDYYGASLRIERTSAGAITVRALSPFQADALDFWD